MTEIPLQLIRLNGAELTEGAAAADDQAQVGSNKYLIVRNGSAGSVSVTLAIPGNDLTGSARPDMVIPIPAGKTRIIPLLSEYSDAAINGLAAITYSATATVTRSVVAY